MKIHNFTKSFSFQAFIISIAIPLLGLSTVVNAADMPKEFDFKVTWTWATTGLKALEVGEKDSFNTHQLTMVATNDAEELFMHNMVGHCNGMMMRIGGTFRQAGACTYEDKDGNQLYETYEADEPGKGKIAFIGGTGPFEGIQCEGEWYTAGFARAGEGGVGKKVGSCKTP